MDGVKMGKLKLGIGQVRAAVCISQGERITGYEFEIIKQGKFTVRDIEMKSWLGIKRHMKCDPREGDDSQCFWFDEWGRSFFDGEYFQMTRIKKNVK